MAGSRSCAKRNQRAQVRLTSRSVDDADDDVADVRARQPRAQQRADRVERDVRAMVARGRRRDPGPRSRMALPSRRVDDRAGRVGVAIAAVGARREQREADAAFAFCVERVGRRERELLAPSARRGLSGAEAHRRLAAPEHAREPRVRIRRGRRVEAAGFAKPHELVDETLRGERRIVEQRLADDSDRSDAERARRGGRRVERVTGCRG